MGGSLDLKARYDNSRLFKKPYANDTVCKNTWYGKILYATVKGWPARHSACEQLWYADNQV